MSGNSRRRKELRSAENSKGTSQPVPKSVAPTFSFANQGEALSLLGFAVGMASWGWSVISPDSSAIFGSILLFVAMLCAFLAICKMWSLKRFLSFTLGILLFAVFASFDWYIVIKPQRGKEFKDLLTEGYHINGECTGFTGGGQLPEWMRDQSKSWQARTEQMISKKLNYKYLQLWGNSVIIGWASDENTVSYQCTLLATKVGTLETIVSENYDKSLQHRDYNGPIYTFHADSSGSVDVSEALKHGNNTAIQVFGDGKDKNIHVTGHLPEPEKK